MSVNNPGTPSMTFEELLKINCFSESAAERAGAADLLERLYCCEIRCADMDESVLLLCMSRA